MTGHYDHTGREHAGGAQDANPHRGHQGYEHQGNTTSRTSHNNVGGQGNSTHRQHQQQQQSSPSQNPAEDNSVVLATGSYDHTIRLWDALS